MRFVHSRIEDLADAGVVGPFDGILAAYLIRNLADPDGTLRRFRGLLRPGGRLAVHEYSVRDSRRATAAWNAVCAAVIIPAGRLRTGDATLYRHLRRSVNAFDGAGAIPGTVAPQRFHRRAQRDDAGLAARHRAHLHSGRRRDDRSAPRRAPRTAGCTRCGDALAGARTSWWSARGIAGLAAATALAERGVTVEVVEREHYLGGRVGGWTRDPARRHRGGDEPRLPRVLPPVLQPAQAAGVASIRNCRC